MSNSDNELDLNLPGFTKEILLSTAFVTAISYYIGWSELAAYYLWFGISPSFISKPIPEVIGTAWEELLLGVLVIVLGIVAHRIVSKMPIEPSDEKIIGKYISIFIFFLVMSGITLSSVLYLRQIVAIRGALPVVVIYSFLLFLYIATILGARINETIKRNHFSNRIHKLFKTLYPSSVLYVFFMLSTLVLVVNTLGIWKGSGRAADDEKYRGQGMLGVSLYSDKALPIEGEIYDQSHQIYSYENLKLVDLNEKYIFVVKFVTSDSFTTYIVPKTEGLVIKSAP